MTLTDCGELLVCFCIGQTHHNAGQQITCCTRRQYWEYCVMCADDPMNQPTVGAKPFGATV